MIDISPKGMIAKTRRAMPNDRLSAVSIMVSTFAFSQIMELFWASLHGIAELTRTKRLPGIRQKEGLSEIVQLFNTASTVSSQ